MYITIGRNPQSDIVITGYDVVSYDHATIEYENGNFLFIDDSSNGSIVNGQRINHESRPVRQGDSIMLAGVCPLNWDLVLAKINMLRENKGTVAMNDGRATQMYNNQASNYQQPGYYQQPVQAPQPNNSYQQDRAAVNNDERTRFYNREINSWNWGAFLLGWIWGIFNNVYWTLIALIPIPFCSLVVAIIAGIKGTKQSWENGKWQDSDISKIKKKQKGWMIAGFIVLGVEILLPIIFWSTFIQLIASMM